MSKKYFINISKVQETVLLIIVFLKNKELKLDKDTKLTF